jgi:threonine/homoserine/homoserine lactone efflux protein
VSLPAAHIDWLGFIAAVAILEATPGVNMAWLAALSLTKGRRAGLAATLGIAIGLTLNAMLAGAGLAELVQSHPELQVWLRRGGAVLMLFLAWRTWIDQTTEPSPQDGRNGFAAGLLLNIINPKAFVFFLVVVPPFLTGGALQLRQAFALGLTSVGIATAVHLAIVFSAGHAHAWLSDTSRTRTVRRIMAAVMVGVAVWFLAG